MLTYIRGNSVNLELYRASQVVLILFLALPGCSLANSHTFFPISVDVINFLQISLATLDIVIILVL